MARPDTTAMLAEFDALVEINGRLMFAKANYNEGEAEAFGIRLLEFFNRHAIDLRAGITAASPAPAIGRSTQDGFFSADPANGVFDTWDTLDDARKDAEKLLEYAAEEAADSGWADDPPQICFGIVLGGCVESAREPAPVGSEFTELVEYALIDYPATTAAQAPEPSGLGSAAHRLLDWQPLAHLNKGDRLWQILEHAGLPADDQPAAIAAVIDGGAE